MNLGVALPVIDAEVGGDPDAIRDFAQAAEEIGYRDLSAPDHVLGVNAASRPGWGDRNTSADLFQDPFVLFGFLAGCTRAIGFSTARRRARTRAMLPSTGAVWRPKAIAAIAAAV